MASTVRVFLLTIMAAEALSLVQDGRLNEEINKRRGTTGGLLTT